MPQADHSSRMLLPRGFVRLRADLGDFLKRHRQGKLEGEVFGTQAQVAAKAGITRQTLSDIERGAAWPGPATLEALLDILNVGWEHVAHPIKSDADPRAFVNDMPGGGRLTSLPSATAPERHRAFLEGAEGNQIIALGENSICKEAGWSNPCGICAGVRHFYRAAFTSGAGAASSVQRIWIHSGD